MEIVDLINQYRIEAIKHGEYSEKGDSKKGNKAYKKMQKIVDEILVSEDSVKLLELFKDPNKWVQLWAASHAIDINKNLSLEKLKELRDENLPHISMNAKYTILEFYS